MALNSDVKALIGSSKRALNGNKFLLMLQSNGIVNLPHKDMEQIKKEVKILEDMKSVVREPIILVLDPQVQVRTHKDIPSHEEFSELLEEKDLYVFVGHDTGTVYFPLKKLEKLHICAAAFLMGCANGSSRLKGYYPPYCVPLSYLYAGAPLIVCTLWELVSRENSLFTWRLIELLFQERSKPQRERRTIGALVNKVRSGSTLKYVDGVPSGIIEKVKP